MPTLEIHSKHHFRLNDVKRIQETIKSQMYRPIINMTTAIFLRVSLCVCVCRGDNKVSS